MIIRSIELEHWRGLPHFQCTLEDGLNVICGPNEAGKSTLVEALHWALFQDIVGGGKIKGEIEAIIPAFSPLELPSVKVLLSFPGCEAIITKRLSPEAAGRECRLLLKRENQPDEHYEQSRAQELLWQLMSNDGQLSGNPGLVPDDAILFSKQGKSTFYVDQDISAMVRSALSDNPAINAQGGISLSPRLETVRQKLQKLRAAQLGKRLSTSAIESALKQSPAAALRDQLSALNLQLEKQRLLLQSIEADRRRIRELEPALELSQKQLQESATELQAKTQLLQQQQQADQLVTEKTLHCNAAQTVRDQLGTAVQNIERHRETIAASQKKIQTAQSILDAAREKVAALQGAMEEAEKNNTNCHQQQREKLYALEAWRSWLEVKEKQTHKNYALQTYNHLRELAESWQAAQKQLPDGDKLIQASRLSNWRERYRDIETEEKRLAHQMRFDLKWEMPLTVKWRADDGEWQCQEIPAGTPFNIRGKSTFDLHLQDAGRIKVATREAKTTSNDERSIQTKRQSLARELAKYSCDDVILPDGFESLEKRVEAQQQLQKAAEEARTHWRAAVTSCRFAGDISSIENTNAVLAVAYEQLQTSTQDWENARDDALQYKDFYPAQVTPAMAKEALRTAMKERSHWATAAQTAEKDYKQKSAQFHQEKEQTTRLENDLRSEREKIDHAENELRRLCEDGQSDAARKTQLKECTDSWLLANNALKNAAAERAKLGEPISTETIEQLENKLQTLREQIGSNEALLSACRARLEYQCQDDPQNVLEQWEFESEELTSRLSREETRLRGLVVLQSALEAQRLRFGDSIAGPLNARLSPWLSTLRGKTTQVEFDASGKRLCGVQTQDTHGHYRLNFTAHSGGMQEQAALLVRLIYLQMASERLPSRRLPVILDDPLTHTDTARRHGLLKVLLEAANSLQIIYVSCHQEHLSQFDGAARIEL